MVRKIIYNLTANQPMNYSHALKLKVQIGEDASGEPIMHDWTVLLNTHEAPASTDGYVRSKGYVDDYEESGLPQLRLTGDNKTDSVFYNIPQFKGEKITKTSPNYNSAKTWFDELLYTIRNNGNEQQMYPSYFRKQGGLLSYLDYIK